LVSWKKGSQLGRPISELQHCSRRPAVCSSLGLLMHDQGVLLSDPFQMANETRTDLTMGVPNSKEKNEKITMPRRKQARLSYGTTDRYDR
jgi:hypothetical protein